MLLIIKIERDAVMKSIVPKVRMALAGFVDILHCMFASMFQPDSKCKLISCCNRISWVETCKQ